MHTVVVVTATVVGGEYGTVVVGVLGKVVVGTVATVVVVLTVFAVVGTVVWLAGGVKGRVVVVTETGVVPVDEPLLDREGEPTFSLEPWLERTGVDVIDVVALSGGCSVVTVTADEGLAALASWAKLLIQKPVTIPDPMKIICESWRTRANRCRRNCDAIATSFIGYLRGANHQPSSEPPTSWPLLVLLVLS